MPFLFPGLGNTERLVGLRSLQVHKGQMDKVPEAVPDFIILYDKH